MFISSATCCKGNRRYHERGCHLSDKSDCLLVDTVFDCLFYRILDSDRFCRTLLGNRVTSLTGLPPVSVK
jgi:hypothetical protein